MIMEMSVFLLTEAFVSLLVILSMTLLTEFLFGFIAAVVYSLVVCMTMLTVHLTCLFQLGKTMYLGVVVMDVLGLGHLFILLSALSILLVGR